MSSDYIKDWAYNSPGVGFDIKDKIPLQKNNSRQYIPTIESYNPEVNSKITPSQKWELDVRGLIDSKKWLMQYGLKKNRLDLKSLLCSLGFRQNEDYDRLLRKPVSSKYGESLFLKHSLEDGSVYNITAKKEQVKQVEQRLHQAISLYKRRLEWLTTESRRIFGVIQEHCVVIVLDIKNLSPRMFDQYLCGIERVVREQLSQIAKFNLIRCAEEMICYAPECVAVTSQSIELAIDWLWKLDRLAPTGPANTIEGIVRASVDPNAEAIYLFTEGESSDHSREVLREKVRNVKVPLHVISFNCTSQDVIVYLRDLCNITGGRFHAYAITIEVDSYEGLPIDPETSKANIVVRRKLYGGVPPGAGTRSDCLAIFEEMEEARNLLSQIQILLAQTPDPKMQLVYGDDDHCHPDNPLRIWDKDPAKQDEMIERDVLTSHQRKEEYMSSKEWLERFGLKARKLDFFDVLAGISFRHCDGVVDVMHPPDEAYDDPDFSLNSQIQPKLVNAKYCDKFAHVRWKDGRIVHVQMTPEVHRLYEQRMSVALSAIRRRIDWLRQGSRELFGTIVEEQVYILIDTSGSMEPSIQFVKDKLFVLMQEQIRHKSKVNFVAFNSKAFPWKDRLVDVTETNLLAAWSWIKAQSCYGSTNTLAALKFALNDRQTHAIYLLSDGRPDHPPKTVLSQVMLHNRVPVHAISFNCADKEANDFLCTLAKETGGRFHYFSETGDKDPEAPDAWESEDIRLLKEEYDLGMENLEKVSRLREECHRLAWNRDTHKKDVSTTDVTESLSLSRLGDQERPRSAPSYEKGAHNSHRSRARSPLKPLRISKGMPQIKHGHTRTSLLRTLNSSGKFSVDEWVLPETREMLDRQAKREKNAIYNEDRNKEHLRAHKKKTADLTEFLSDSEPPSYSSIFPVRIGKTYCDSRLRVRNWLRKYGLIPQRMTILDVLAPTVVEQRPKYVPILDKEILSKVFDDVLPIAHVSKTRKGGISLVNPNAVDLSGYREKLSGWIGKYQKKLSDIITAAIGKEEVKQILETAGDDELNMETHRAAIFEALDRTGWGVSESDIQLLEKEIAVAQKYYAQAEDLEKAGREEAIRGSKEEIASTGEGFGQILKKNGQRTGEMSKPPQDGKSVRKVLDSLRGQHVISRDDRDGLYYTAHVVRCPNVRVATVEFDDQSEGETRTVPTRFCIPISGAISCPNLQVRDTVLIRCNNDDNGRVCFAPGIITALPSNNHKRYKFYTIKLFNGTKCHSLRIDIVKIGQTRHNFIVQDLYSKNALKKSQFSLIKRDNETTTTNSQVGTDVGEPNPVAQSNTNYAEDKLEKEEKYQSQLSDLMEDIDDVEDDSEIIRRKTKSPDSHKLKDESSKDDMIMSKLCEYNTRLEEQGLTMKKLQEALEEQQRVVTEKQKRMKKELRTLKSRERKRSKRQALNDQVAEHDRIIKNLQEKLEPKTPVPDTPEIDETVDNAEKNEEIEPEEPPVQDLNIGEEVLARWLDDGWYYRGMIKEWHGDGSYTVEDGSRHSERIYREDIIRDKEDVSDILTADLTVVALHPSYSFSYSPAVVTKVLPNLWLEVRFYDGVEVRLPREECYQINSEKFEAVVRYIIDSEKQWVGQAVVARDNLTGTFNLAQVKQRVGSGKQYIIEWADGRLATQSSGMLFGAFTRRHNFRNGDRVLACADLKNLTYLPGWVSSTGSAEDKIAVRFCNGKRVDNIDTMHSFWLSQEFYEQAVQYWKKHSGG